MSPCGDALGGFVITETSPEGGAYFDPNTRVVTIGADTLKSGNTWQEGLDQSALNGSKVGEIVEGVAQGVGQMLPAVAVSFIPGVGQAASLGTIMASAAGTGTEEAFGEGASYGKGLAYGAASGAVEGATEKLTGGMGKLFGGGVLDNVLGDVAKVGVKRVAKEAVGEGVEEMISEVAGPALKTIYRGKDALSEYGEGDFWSGVLEAGVIGAGTSVAYGGTVGRALKTTGVYADARSVTEHIGEQKKLRAKSGLSQVERVQIEQNIKADNEVLSKQLQKLSESKRAKVFEKMPALQLTFDTDGNVRTEQTAALDANIAAAKDTTYDVRYRSSTLSAETITKALQRGSTEDHEMRAFSGEMSETQQKNLDDVREMMGAVSERSGDALGGFVITETSPEGGAYFDPNTRVVTIGADTLKSGSASEAVTHALEKDGTLGTIVHEVTHGIEETNAGKKLAKLVTDDADLHDLAIKDVLERGYMREYFGENADANTVADGIEKLIAKENAGRPLTEAEQAALDEYHSEVAAFANQRLLGNKAFMKKLITTEPSTAEKLIGKIREMRENLKVRKDAEAKAQLELVRKAEKLFMQGLSEAGGTIDSKGKIHLADREDDKDEVKRLANPKNVDNLTEEQYNNFGWVRANDVLTSGEWKDFTSKFADAVTKQMQSPKTKSGEYMIAVSDIDDVLHYGTDNIIVYAKGSIESPQVSRVLEIDLDNETDLDRKRRETYDLERRGIQQKAGGIRRFHYASDYGSRYDGQRASRQSIENSGQLGADRGRGRRTTDRIKEFKVNDDGSFTTVYADGRVVTEPPKVKHSRSVSETVTLSKGQIAALRANYEGDKVFTKKEVTAAIQTVDALQKLPAKVRGELATKLWRGYNEHLNEQGFEKFTEIMWHQIHAEVLQETGFEMSEDEIRVMDEQIVVALNTIVKSGKPSIKARLESDTSTEGYRKQADFWRGEHSKAVQRNKQLNSLKFELEKLANQKKGLYVNAASYRGDSFKVAIDELAKMNWRGGLVSDTKIRERFASLAAWYTKKNPLYAGDGNGNELFRQEIADALTDLGNSQNGALTVEDLQAAETVVKYFAHEIEAHNTVYKDGKRVDAMPEAKGYIEKARRAKEIAAKCGMWSNLMRSEFARMVADPAMLMRQADGYLSGFFTEQYEALRQGTIDANVKERELSEEFEKFWEEHKAYGKRYNDTTVKFGDAEMPLQEAISLYMTMKREHAFTGLAGAGFEIDGKDATENISDGFAEEVNRQLAGDWKELPPEELLTLTKKKNAEMERAALRKVIEQKRKALYDQFTDEDKALISLMERAFEKCRDVKVRIDEIVQGYSNVTNGYYYPIKRTGLAENVDAYTGFEGDRVSNLSMNKETVKNAHKLYIEPAHIVFMRHLKATSLYHGLGVFTDNFNRLYNLDITGPQIKEAAQSAAAQAYAKAEVNRGIVELVEKVKRGEHKANDFVDLGTVSADVAGKIKEVTGQDFTGYKIAVEARQIEHILKRHGENGSANHSMAKDEDIAKMMHAILASDYVSDGGTTRAYVYSDNGRLHPAKTVIHEKAIGQKSYYTIQTAVDTKKKTLHIVSAFIGDSGYKRGAPQTLDANDPRGNAQSGNVGTPTNSVPQNGGGVNTAEPENYRGGPKTVRDALGQSTNFAKEMITYFKELKQDVEGISKKRSQERWYNDAVGFIRSSYATYLLGVNPKVWATQFSSLVAATNILDADCLAKGLTVSGKDVDEYCRLAWLRNNDGAAVLAQSVTTGQNAVQRAGRNVLQKIRDVAMLPIGKVDRLVITRLFGACQVQVEKQGGAKVGTKENKIEAGKLLQRVILETQQNSLATERSGWMRSDNELIKGLTMFSADAMKVGARFVDAFGELSVLRTLRKEAKKAGSGAEVERLNKEIKRARKQCVRATVSLVGVALFNAALAYGFKWLYRRDEDESLGTFIADTFGNMLGGIPFVRDLWSFFQDGFEMDHFLISTVNDVLGTAAASFQLVSDAASGKEVTRQEALANMRKVLYAAGQLSGVPTRNLYNFTTGVVNRVSPEAGYALESQFFKKSYASDLQKALDAGDDKIVGTIAGLMIDEKIGIEDDAMRKVLQSLTEKGHSVLPRSVGDSVTVDGETVTLTGAQQKKLRSVYSIGQEAVADMVKLKQFSEADDEVKEKAIKFIYDVYWDLALEDTLGLDLAEKNVLFAEAISIEKLAIIIATARSVEADKDKDGKSIAGTKKRKLQTFVNSLRLSAAEKYMVMGYLGYSNVNGEQQVMSHINKLNLNQYEKIALLEYCGYELSKEDRMKMHDFTLNVKYAPYGGQDPNDPERIAPK